jgi:hypothetical protein
MPMVDHSQTRPAISADPVGYCGEVGILADQELAVAHPKRPIGEIAAAEHVGDHRVDTVVVTSDRGSPGHVPDNVGAKQRADGLDRPPGIEACLGALESGKELRSMFTLRERRCFSAKCADVRGLT